MKPQTVFTPISVKELEKWLLTQCEFLGQRVDGALMTGIATRNLIRVADVISNMHQKQEAIVISPEQLREIMIDFASYCQNNVYKPDQLIDHYLNYKP